MDSRITNIVAEATDAIGVSGCLSFSEHERTEYSKAFMENAASALRRLELGITESDGSITRN